LQCEQGERIRGVANLAEMPINTVLVNWGLNVACF